MSSHVIQFVGGPRDGDEMQVPDDMHEIKMPILPDPMGIYTSLDTEPTIIDLKCAYYMRARIPYYFSYVGTW